MAKRMQDKESIAGITWLALLIIAGWGGLVRFLMDVKQGKAKWSWINALAQIVVSGFTGVIGGRPKYLHESGDCWYQRCNGFCRPYVFLGAYYRSESTMTADQIIEAILSKEGGYVNNPNDKGGPTRWGITQNTARAYGYKGDMKELPRETAKEIYMQQYWLEPKFDKIAELSPSIAEELCDTGVNMGPRVSTTFLQRWLTALNQRGKLYPDLKPDGVIGNITIAALRSYLAVRGSAGVTVMLKGLNCSQGARYLELAEAREANEEFLFGWVKERVNL